MRDYTVWEVVPGKGCTSGGGGEKYEKAGVGRRGWHSYVESQSLSVRYLLLSVTKKKK